MTSRVSTGLHEFLTGEGEGRVCKGIPEATCNRQPVNFTTHVTSVATTMTGDEPADPKLAQAWFLGALGALLPPSGCWCRFGNR